MNAVSLAATRLAGMPGRGDLLVVGPSLGTSVSALWSACARLLGDRFEVVGWDLPGHGRSAPAGSPFDVTDLVGAVATLAESLTTDRASNPASGPGLSAPGLSGRRRWYAGVSAGGAVGLQAALDSSVFEGVAVIASSARIGEPAAWHERAELVRRAGTTVMVEGSAGRWFAPGFIEAHPADASALLTSLADTDDESYALVCEALAAYDVRQRLPDLAVPVVLMPGELDQVVTPDQARATVDAAPGATLQVLTGCAHLPPAEDPSQTAAAIATLCATPSVPPSERGTR